MAYDLGLRWAVNDDDDGCSPGSLCCGPTARMAQGVGLCMSPMMEGSDDRGDHR
jgi:hypothetical protein